MSEFRRRRNWQTAAAVKGGQGGFTVWLDSRAAQTPGGNSLTLPTRRLADRIADEWNGQSDVVDFRTMPFTRLAGGAVDWLACRRSEAVSQICAYAAHELLCHRAPESEPLSERQNAAWGPVLQWAESEFEAPLNTVHGIMPVRQPKRSLENLRRQAAGLTEFTLAAFIDMVTLTGSFLLGLSLIHDRLGPAQAWELSRIDEEWQAERWGRDRDAESAAQAKRDEFMIACEFEAAARILPDSA